MIAAIRSGPALYESKPGPCKLTTPTYRKTVQQSSGPLGFVARGLRRGFDVRGTLARGLGSQLADRFVYIATHVIVRDVRAPAELVRTAPNGKRWAPARTAVATLEQHQVHDPNSPTVRNMARVLTLVCSWLGPNKRTGHALQGHWLNVEHLAKRVGLEVKEVERYLAIFRSQRLLLSWQPPSSSGAPKGNRSGHAFNLYELASLPPELERHLKAFHRSWWPKTPAEREQQAWQADRRAPVTEAGRAAFERFKPPD